MLTGLRHQRQTGLQNNAWSPIVHVPIVYITQTSIVVVAGTPVQKVRINHLAMSRKVQTRHIKPMTTPDFWSDVIMPPIVPIRFPHFACKGA